ncbi:hypothetical protein GBAR_LOCUS26398 [Geodia barretti]|uniref:Uncharacterized protein n=1 Tax=Geodia barretti TaxID=519541 RepID=A0AA35TIG8_GEOBA|nr:hypothetical protein GBAR_LOCUS26398 [Geodia barretti]
MVKNIFPGLSDTDQLHISFRKCIQYTIPAVCLQTASFISSLSSVLSSSLSSFSLTSLSLSSSISDQFASTSSASISYPTKNGRDRGCSLRTRDQSCRRPLTL